MQLLMHSQDTVVAQGRVCGQQKLHRADKKPPPYHKPSQGQIISFEVGPFYTLKNTWVGFRLLRQM